MPVTQTNFPSIVPILVRPVPQKRSAHRDVTRGISDEELQGRFTFVCVCSQGHVPSCPFSEWSWLSRVRKNLLKQGLSFLLTHFAHFSHPSEISRFENTLQEYKIYKDFLYQLSPKEWQEEHVKKHTKQSNTASKANQESASPLTAEEEGKCHGRAPHSSPGQLHALNVHLFWCSGPGLTAGLMLPVCTLQVIQMHQVLCCLQKVWI